MNEDVVIPNWFSIVDWSQFLNVSDISRLPALAFLSKLGDLPLSANSLLSSVEDYIESS